jgi:ferredoxin
MIINQKKCVACGNCVAVCPMNAIYVNSEKNRAQINDSECVECGTCLRGMSTENLNPYIIRAIRKLAKLLRFRFEPEPDVCPTAAFEMNKLEMPRLIRQIFSDPVVEHESTGIKGRGTEEVKTNDVRLRINTGEIGITIELGRPGVGVKFSDIQVMSKNLAAQGIEFEKNNPVTQLMTDTISGDLRPDILNEKILSAIIEIKTSITMVEKVLSTIREVSKIIDTVTTVGISTRCDENGEDNLLSPLLNKLGYHHYRAKTNMGLGRFTNIIQSLHPEEYTK